MRALLAVIGVAAVVYAAPASAQFGPCASIADPAQRLACYDRQGTGARPPAQYAPPPPAAAGGGACTPASPCVGPRGGVYYYTASGNRRYLPRR